MATAKSRETGSGYGRGMVVVRKKGIIETCVGRFGTKTDYIDSVSFIH
jgi:hypothetical protein